MENILIQKIEIQPFAVKHVEDVTEIHSQVQDGWSMKSLISDLANSSTQSYVATFDGRAVGFCSYLVTDDAELVFVCTHPSFEKQGIATKLLSETIAAFPEKIKNVVLEVRSHNEKAIGLYNKLGFSKLGIRKGFYSFPSDDAVVMEYVKSGVKELD